jgi:hypothetical protein
LSKGAWVRVTGNEGRIKVEKPTSKPKHTNPGISNTRTKEALIKNHLSS